MAFVTLLLSSIVQANAVAQTRSHPCISGLAQVATISTIDKRKRTFQIRGSKQIYSLAGLEISKPSNEIKVGNAISIFGQDQKPDRYGAFRVQVFKDDGKSWLQGALLGDGSALLNESSENLSPQCLVAMRKAEHEAIASKVGLWTQKQAIIAADQVDQLTNKTGFYSVVEGKVLSIGDRKRRLYLNFGQNWSQDFTLSVVKKGKGAFKGSLNLLTGLKEKTVRVRGVLEERQGPLIRLFNEAQIEIIDK